MITRAPYWLGAILTLALFIFAPVSAQAERPWRGTYRMIDTSFQLPGVMSDPFDYEQTAVTAQLRQPDHKVLAIPAFFDGATTWRVRFTPTQPGQYEVESIQLNGHAVPDALKQLKARQWKIAGPLQPGFIGVDAQDSNRFVFDNGTRYFPLGHNQAWQNGGQPDIPTLFAKMGAAGENWSRIWMNHWDGKNLDWPPGGNPAKLGTINLNAARKWDAIVEAAGRNGIYFQMTLQHHGQYSSGTNPNWGENPYNVKNGGFLKQPQDFFTDAQAKALTKRKLYYILARWGYSPNILAFELFNEVQFTDAAHDKQWTNIAVWHTEMAAFLRQHDPYHHLITTSSAPDTPAAGPVWQALDYYQRHAYPSDILTSLGGLDGTRGKAPGKPFFTGEFGPSNLQDPDGIYLREGLWASLMSGLSGAAQYWDWDTIEKHNLYSHFKAAQAFITASGLANQDNLTRITPLLSTTQRGDLSFGPGAGWKDVGQSEFTVKPMGAPAGMDQYPSFFQGQYHRAMNPKPLTFHVNYAQPGAFSITLSQIAKVGAHLVLKVDGQTTERDFPAANNDHAPNNGQASLQVVVPAGQHVITLENTGLDWVVLRSFTFSSYAPALAAMGLVNRSCAVAWVYQRANLEAKEGKLAPSISGQLTLSGLAPGHYHIGWMDTATGQALGAPNLMTGDGKPLALTTPLISRDAALYIRPANTAAR